MSSAYAVGSLLRGDKVHNYKTITCQENVLNRIGKASSLLLAPNDCLRCHSTWSSVLIPGAPYFTLRTPVRHIEE